MKKLTIFSWYALLLLLIRSCTYAVLPESPAEPAYKIPFSAQIIPDGNSEDWQDMGLIRVLSDIEGNMPDPEDFQARFSLAWDSAGLLILIKIQDDIIYEDPETFWKGDGIELFVSPSKGSDDILQISIRPSIEISSEEPAVQYFDYRKSDSMTLVQPTSEFFRKVQPGGYLIEGRVPFNSLGIVSGSGSAEMAVQIYFNDADMKDDSNNYSLPWYPVRESYSNPYAFQKLKMRDKKGVEGQFAGTVVSPEVRAFITDNKILNVRVLSESELRDHSLGFRSFGQEKYIHLKKDRKGFYLKSFDQVLNKSPDPGNRIEFFMDDSLVFSAEPILLHRVYSKDAEPNGFEPEIRIFEIRDYFNPPPSGGVLFAGSSTFRKWEDIEDYLPGHQIINRGFGGSKMEDLNYYFERIVLPYRPARIFIYEGDNDIAGGYSPEKFIADCRLFIRACHENLPDAELYFLSIKPSPSRFKYREDMDRANRMLSGLCDGIDKVNFVDISEVILDRNGRPDPELFISDRLHFNEKGYAVLAGILNPILNQ